MPTLQVEVTKSEQDPWILSIDSPPSTEFFSQEDIDTVLLPYSRQLRSIPGLINITETVEGNVRTVSYEFDSLESMPASKEVMVNSELAQTRSRVIRDSMLAHGITPYTIRTRVV